MPITMLLVLALAPTAPVPVTPQPCGLVVAVPPATPDTTPVPLAGCARPSSDATNAVTIRMYNRATTTDGQRLQAQTVSQAALRSAGVQPVWRDCAGATGDASKPGNCAEPLGARELIVRFEDAPRRTPPSVLGFAYVPGVVATVLVDRVREMAQRSDTSFGELLGGVMAHEIMHLLRGTNGHERGGLMRATWSDDDVRHGRIWSIQISRNQRDESLLN